MLKLVRLTAQVDIKLYEMLQRIGPCENEFKNPVYGLSFNEFGEWLVEQEKWSRGKSLPTGLVAQTIFWMYNDDTPIGIGKIRHRLTDSSRLIGGNIGYAIDPLYRGHGYATMFLGLLIREAHDMNIDEILLTVEKYNPASKKVIERNGGILVRENDERWFFEFQ